MSIERRSWPPTPTMRPLAPVSGMAPCKRREAITIAHVTPGSPRDLSDARAAGCATGAEYARVRRQELYAAVGLTALVDLLAAPIGELRPELILTRAYEGGHADHDAALKLCPGAAHEEFASYHAGPHGVVNGEFLPAGSEERVPILTEAERILKLFPLDTERFRPAPTYDFTRPPHAGELQYERFGFGIGTDWRRSAAEALQSLEWRAWA